MTNDTPLDREKQYRNDIVQASISFLQENGYVDNPTSQSDWLLLFEVVDEHLNESGSERLSWVQLTMDVVDDFRDRRGFTVDGEDALDMPPIAAPMFSGNGLLHGVIVFAIVLSVALAIIAFVRFTEYL